jgi:peptidoglycan/xylan/chitin deacetylase (PgdA/CDA1 family)
MNSRNVLIGLLVGLLVIAVAAVVLALSLLAPADTEADQPAPSLPPADTLFPGTYYLSTGVNDPLGSANFVLELRRDGTASNTTYPTDPEAPVHILQGSWTVEDNRAIVLMTERDGAPLDESIRIVFVYRDLFLVAVEHPFGDQQYEFTLGAGDEHPAVRQLHQLLAGIPWLDFQDPGPEGIVYDEETRRAVTTFQISQGLSPSGVVDQQTWDALNNPVPPASATAPAPGVPDATRPPADFPGSVADRPTHIDGQPVVYLTFDDGPSSYTPRFQDILAQHNAYATFFLIGQQVSGPTVGAGAASGQYQANHTYSHVSLSGLDFSRFSQELGAGYETIQSATGGQDAGRSKLLCVRPPYGETDANTRAYAAQLGYELVTWDIDPQDWRQPGAGQIAEHVIDSVYPGAIVLMHDGGGQREQTLEALNTILATLMQQGYRFESLCR